MNLGVWALLGITGLGGLMIYAGLEADTTNLLFVTIGGVLLLPGLVVLIIGLISDRKFEAEKQEQFEQLLATGDQIEVDLEQVVIKSNSYQKEVEVDSARSSRLEIVDVNHNVVLFEVDYKGELVKFRSDVLMEPEKLRMHFAIQQKTTLYLDPDDPYNYYLDLRFLER